MIHAGLQAGALALGVAVDAQHMGNPLETHEAIAIAELRLRATWTLTFCYLLRQNDLWSTQ